MPGVGAPGVRVFPHVLGEFVRGALRALMPHSLNPHVTLAADGYPLVAQKVGVDVLACVDNVYVQRPVVGAALDDLDEVVQQLATAQPLDQPMPRPLKLHGRALGAEPEGNKAVRPPALLKA